MKNEAELWILDFRFGISLRRDCRERAKTQDLRLTRMKDLKKNELSSLTVPELEEMLMRERAALYKARRDLVFRQIKDTTGLKVRRHNMARILTEITEKRRGGSE